MKPAERNFFSTFSGLTGPRGARFSLTGDVIAFSGLIDLATDQSFVSRNAENK
jgi:hypothetical protein